MAGNSAIEWTEATWNPIVGCSILTPGCTHCYAMGEAARQIRCAAGLGRETHYAGTVKTVKGKPVWTGKLALAPESILLQPLKRKKPTIYFVNSMGDLGHEDVPPEWFAHCMVIMAMAQQHTFQLLTKRSEHLKNRLLEYSASTIEDLAADFGYSRLDVTDKWPLPNVWIGASTERQQEADERIPLLLQTPAAVRFISAEPLLGRIDLVSPLYTGEAGITMRGYLRDHAEPDDFHHHASKLDWVIVGGESGPGSRPMHPDWARSLRDQCSAAGVPFFFKQWGEWAPQIGAVDGWTIADNPEISRFDHREWEDGQWSDVFRPMWCDFQDGNYDETQTVSRIGKKRAGSLLDGKLHNEFPTRGISNGV